MEETKGMLSLRELYKIGAGPSSSHTMGPKKACEIFLKRNIDADSFKAVLYGSLAKTGKGHGTDRVIKETFYPKRTEVEFVYDSEGLPHPNTMDLFSYNADKIVTDHIRVLSVGGGDIVIVGEEQKEKELVYPHTKYSEIFDICQYDMIRIWEYVERYEGKEIFDYLQEVWETMKAAIRNGLNDEGVLPGGLNIQKKAKHLYNLEHIDEAPETREDRLVSSFAFAVSEQNACCKTIVTAPTCGASGVLPAVLFYQQKKNHYSDEQIVHALATGGIIGNLIKTNASISGAQGGCQAEVGAACAMAAAALAELFGLNLEKIEYSAEVAIEHHLGLTCDPINGLVQIPCIERNAVAAMRAINAVILSSFLSDTRKISLDNVIIAMKETGLDIARQYKETSEGGLAKINIEC